MKKTTTPGLTTRASHWYSGLHFIHPLLAQEWVSWLKAASFSYPEDVLRRVGTVLAETDAILEFPMGELNTLMLRPWLIRWRAANSLSELYPATESRGSFNAQGLEFLIRVEGESLVSILLAAQHIQQWRFAVSLRISPKELHDRILEAEKGDAVFPARADYGFPYREG